MAMNNRPYAEIVKQPAKYGVRFNDNYPSGYSMTIRVAGNKKSYPTIRVVNHDGPASVVVSCVTANAPYRPHPHRLSFKRKVEQHGTCLFKFKRGTLNHMVISDLSIKYCSRRGIEKSLTEREKMLIDPFMTGFEHKKSSAREINLDCLRLCFQVLLLGTYAQQLPLPLPPLISEPIFNKKRTPELKICWMSHNAASADGGKVICMLCNKVCKNDVKIVFANNDGTWKAQGNLVTPRVYRRYSIVMTTPTYKNPERVLEPIHVTVNVMRISTGEFSKPVPFLILPVENIKSVCSKVVGNRKRSDKIKLCAMLQKELVFRHNRLTVDKPMTSIKSYEPWELPPINDFLYLQQQVTLDSKIRKKYYKILLNGSSEEIGNDVSQFPNSNDRVINLLDTVKHKKVDLNSYGYTIAQEPNVQCIVPQSQPQPASSAAAENVTDTSLYQRDCYANHNNNKNDTQESSQAVSKNTNFSVENILNTRKSIRPINDIAYLQPPVALESTITEKSCNIPLKYCSQQVDTGTVQATNSDHRVTKLLETVEQKKVDINQYRHAIAPEPNFQCILPQSQPKLTSAASTVNVTDTSLCPMESYFNNHNNKNDTKKCSQVVSKKTDFSVEKILKAQNSISPINNFAYLQPYVTYENTATKEYCIILPDDCSQQLDDSYDRVTKWLESLINQEFDPIPDDYAFSPEPDVQCIVPQSQPKPASTASTVNVTDMSQYPMVSYFNNHNNKNDTQESSQVVSEKTDFSVEKILKTRNSITPINDFAYLQPQVTHENTDTKEYCNIFPKGCGQQVGDGAAQVTNLDDQVKMMLKTVKDKKALCVIPPDPDVRCVVPESEPHPKSEPASTAVSVIVRNNGADQAVNSNDRLAKMLETTTETENHNIQYKCAIGPEPDILCVVPESKPDPKSEPGSTAVSVIVRNNGADQATNLNDRLTKMLEITTETENHNIQYKCAIGPEPDIQCVVPESKPDPKSEPASTAVSVIVRNNGAAQSTNSDNRTTKMLETVKNKEIDNIQNECAVTPEPNVERVVPEPISTTASVKVMDNDQYGCALTLESDVQNVVPESNSDPKSKPASTAAVIKVRNNDPNQATNSNNRVTKVLGNMKDKEIDSIQYTHAIAPEPDVQCIVPEPQPKPSSAAATVNVMDKRDCLSSNNKKYNNNRNDPQASSKAVIEVEEYTVKEFLEAWSSIYGESGIF